MPEARPWRWVKETGPLTRVEISARYRKRHPEKSLENQRRYATKHAGRIRDYQRVRYEATYAEGRAWLDEQKKKPCKDCGGEFPPCAMDFDHVRGRKHREVGSMWGCSIAMILVEIAKCDLVCSNCHRVRTFNRAKQ